MIVKCERCQTRFKIPDEKVTEKGVKVRCTKCQHTFRVAREDVSSAAPAPAVPSVEAAPSAKPPATPRAGTPLEVPRTSAPAAPSSVPWGNPPPAAKPPGVAVARGGVPVVPLSRSMEPPKTPATIDLDPLMEFIGDNTPNPTEALKLAAKAPVPNKPAGALALGATPPAPAPKPAPAAKPAQGAAPVPVQVPTRSPAPVQVPAKSPAPALPRSSAPFSFDERDPFGSGGAEPTLADPVPTLPPAPKPAPMPVPARSAPPAPKPAQSAAPAPFQVPARSPAPAPVPSPVSAPMAFEEPDPFALPPDDSPTVPATPTLPPRGAAPAPFQSPGSAPMAFEEPDPFALPPDDSPTVPATPTLPPRSAAPVPAPAPAPVFEEMEGLEGNNPFVSFEPPPPAPARAAAPNENNPFATFDPVAALPPSPAARMPMTASGSFDPVAALPPAAPTPRAPAPAPAAAPSGIPDWGAPQGAAPSGIPDWGAPQGAVPAGMPDWGSTQTVPATPLAKSGAPTERNPFPDFPGQEAAQSREILPDLPSMPPTPAPAPPVIAAPPAKKEEAPGERQGPRLVQRLAAVAAQLVVAAVLVVGLVAVGSAWLNDGRVELSALSPSRMREMVSSTLPLVPKDLSNGLYETRDGHTLFFVRGEVENRGPAPVRVKAHVALYEGDQKVKSAEGLVGAVPTPEELHALLSASEADALRGRLDGAAREVAPGARAPFVVFFYEYPAELAGFRLDVTFESLAKEGKAGNAQP